MPVAGTWKPVLRSGGVSALVCHVWWALAVWMWGHPGSVDVAASVDCRTATTTGVVKYTPEPYAFGVDPIWHGSRSELPFTNSLKMKMSILLGISQMNLGILLSYFNARYFRSALDVW